MNFGHVVPPSLSGLATKANNGRVGKNQMQDYGFPVAVVVHAAAAVVFLLRLPHELC